MSERVYEWASALTTAKHRVGGEGRTGHREAESVRQREVMTQDPADRQAPGDPRVVRPASSGRTAVSRGYGGKGSSGVVMGRVSAATGGRAAFCHPVLF